MPDDENVNLDTENEIVLEETEETPESTETTEETPAVDVEALQATNKKLYERAKKAEADLKALKGAPKPAEAKPASPQNVEETVILDKWTEKGVSNAEELMDTLKKIARVEGISLIKAQTDTVFVAMKEKFEKDQKQKDASLPASRGSGAVKVQKTVSTPGLSREDHKKLAQSIG